MITNIAVLMTCHNRCQSTIKCLKSLFNQRLPADINLKVYLVDDASTDGTSQLVNSIFPSVKIFKGTGDLYWNRGMHLAWKKALLTEIDYDFFLWLNDDVQLKDMGLSNLINDATKKNNSIICGVMESKISKGKVTYGGRYLNEVLVKPSGFPKSCELINGNMVIVPKSIVDDIGILDNFYTHAIGDFEYGLRAIKNGYKCYISSLTVGFCEKNSSPPDWRSNKINIINRIKSLYSPLGYCHPYHFFVFKYKYFGLMSALRTFISIHLRLIIPSLWKN